MPKLTKTILLKYKRIKILLLKKKAQITFLLGAQICKTSQKLDMESIAQAATTAPQARYVVVRLSQDIIIIIIMFVIIHVIAIITPQLLILQRVQQWYLSIHAWDFASVFALYNALEETEELILLINNSLLLFIMLTHHLQIKRLKNKKFLSPLKTQFHHSLLSLKIIHPVLHFPPTKDINTSLFKIKAMGNQFTTMLLLSQDTIHLSSTNNLSILNKLLFNNLSSTIINTMKELLDFERKSFIKFRFILNKI